MATQLTSVGKNLQPWLSQPTTPTGGGTTPPVVTPPVTPSPNGTKITTAAASPIIDQAGNNWTLVQSASNGLQVAVNGAVDPVTAKVVLLETLGGNIVQENTAGNWYSNLAPAAPGRRSWTSYTCRATHGKPGRNQDRHYRDKPDRRSGRQSMDARPISVEGPAGRRQRYRRYRHREGRPAGDPRRQHRPGETAGDWYSEPGPGSAWAQIAAPPVIPRLRLGGTPVTTGSGSDTLVLSISEDAYLGNAQFTVSVDGKQIGGTLTATASHVTAAKQNFTFKGAGRPVHTRAVNFLNDAYGGRPRPTATSSNAGGYDGKATGQASALIGRLSPGASA